MARFPCGEETRVIWLMGGFPLVFCGVFFVDLDLVLDVLVFFLTESVGGLLLGGDFLFPELI